MAREKKPVHRVQMTEGKRNIIHQLLEEYDIQSAEDIQDALKDRKRKIIDGLCCPKNESIIIIRKCKHFTSSSLARNDRCEHFTLSDLWRCAHEKQKNTCRRTIPSHHGMPSKWIDRSSMVCGTRHQTGLFYNWVKRLRQKGCVDLPASIGRSYRAPESQEVVRVDFHD